MSLLTPPRYELSETDVDVAWDCARLMIEYNDRRGWRDRAWKSSGPSRVSNFALGNYGELAVARWLGVAWSCRVGAYAKADVDGLHVRTTRYARRPLLTLYGPEIDPDDGIFVLAALDVPYVELVGWTTGAIGRVYGELRDLGSGVPAFYVAADKLTAMEVLRARRG